MAVTSTAWVMFLGMADSATCRCFSRSLTMSAVSTGVSSVSFSLACVPSSSRAMRSGTFGGFAFAAAPLGGATSAGF